jgi:hypothetical protein
LAIRKIRRVLIIVIQDMAGVFLEKFGCFEKKMMPSTGMMFVKGFY